WRSRKRTYLRRGIRLDLCRILLHDQLLLLGCSGGNNVDYSHLSQSLTSGQSYGVYLSHYLADSVFPNASSIDFAFIGGFNFSMAMIVSPIVTISTRKYGKYLTMSIGIAFQTAGFIGASLLFVSGRSTRRLWYRLPIHTKYSNTVSVVQAKKPCKRYSSARSGVGGACFAWATEAMIQRLSIPWALQTTGVIVFIANSVATAFLRDRNRLIKPPQLAFDWKLLRRYDVQLLLLWAFVSMLGYITLLFSLSDFALSIGLSQSQATNVVGLLNLLGGRDWHLERCTQPNPRCCISNADLWTILLCVLDTSNDLRPHNILCSVQWGHSGGFG
ncbi:unnamed protein product, partial [Aureobasidium pullulans]